MPERINAEAGRTTQTARASFPPKHSGRRTGDGHGRSSSHGHRTGGELTWCAGQQPMDAHVRLGPPSCGKKEVYIKHTGDRPGGRVKRQTCLGKLTSRVSQGHRSRVWAARHARSAAT